jgi:hypothetical protein
VSSLTLSDCSSNVAKIEQSLKITFYAKNIMNQTTTSAWTMIRQLSTQHGKKLVWTFSLVLIENILLVTYPLFAGFAINAMTKGDLLTALVYALVVLGMWAVGLPAEVWIRTLRVSMPSSLFLSSSPSEIISSCTRPLRHALRSPAASLIFSKPICRC